MKKIFIALTLVAFFCIKCPAFEPEFSQEPLATPATTGTLISQLRNLGTNLSTVLGHTIVINSIRRTEQGDLYFGFDNNERIAVWTDPNETVWTIYYPDQRRSVYYHVATGSITGGVQQGPRSAPTRAIVRETGVEVEGEQDNAPYFPSMAPRRVPIREVAAEVQPMIIGRINVQENGNSIVSEWGATLQAAGYDTQSLSVADFFALIRILEEGYEFTPQTPASQIRLIIGEQGIPNFLNLWQNLPTGPAPRLETNQRPRSHMVI